MGKSQVSLEAASEAQAAELELEGFLGYNLKRAYVIVQADFRRTLGEGGLSPRSFSALTLAVQIPNITQSELARMLGIERSGLVAIVDELEGRGFLRRVPVPGDRRVQALAPTAGGKAACAAAVKALRAHEQRLFASFTAAEQAQLLSLLRKLRAAHGGGA